MVFHCSLSESKSLQVSGILLGILADFKNAVIWMVTICPPISYSSAYFPTLREPFQADQLHLVSSSLKCFIKFLVL